MGKMLVCGSEIEDGWLICKWMNEVLWVHKGQWQYVPAQAPRTVYISEPRYFYAINHKELFALDISPSYIEYA